MLKPSADCVMESVHELRNSAPGCMMQRSRTHSPGTPCLASASVDLTAYTSGQAPEPFIWLIEQRDAEHWMLTPRAVFLCLMELPVDPPLDSRFEKEWKRFVDSSAVAYLSFTVSQSAVQHCAVLCERRQPSFTRQRLIFPISEKVVNHVTVTSINGGPVHNSELSSTSNHLVFNRMYEVLIPNL